MTTNKPNTTERDLRRRAIEQIIAQYPKIGQDQLHRLFDYFRRGASNHDIARIGMNPAIRRQYREVCRDHRVDQLKHVDWIFAAMAGLLATVDLASLAGS